jgi:hypothetical protein
MLGGSLKRSLGMAYRTRETIPKAFSLEVGVPNAPWRVWGPLPPEGCLGMRKTQS